MLVAICLIEGCIVTIAREYFRVIDSRMGLPDNTVEAIVQDSKGYIWLGTTNGLCRYDGVAFTTFRHDPDNENSLSSSFVNSLAVAPAGLFVGTNTGLDLYSFAGDGFVHCTQYEGGKLWRVSQTIHSIVCVNGIVFYTDAAGGLYANKRGDATRFHRISKKFKAYALCSYQNKMLLAACSDGLRLIEANSGRVVAFCKYAPGPLDKLNVSYIPATRTAYVGSGIGFGSAAFIIGNNTITRSSAYSPKDLTCAIPFKGSTMFGTDGRGVEIENKGHVTLLNTANSSISGNVVYSLFVDRVGDIWIGSYRSGLNHYVSDNNLFSLFDKGNSMLSFDIVTSIVPAAEKIYIGLDGGGLDIYDRKTRKVTVLNTGNSSIAGDNVVSMVKDDDNLWLAVYTKGLVQYSLSTGKFTTWTMPGNGGEKNNVWCLYDDGSGNVWVAGPRLYAFNKAKHKFIDVKGLPDVKGSAITGFGHYVWVSSNVSGIYKIDKRNMKIVAHYSRGTGKFCLPSDNIKYAYVDSKGEKLWFTAENIGFYSMDLKTGEVVRYDVKNGLTYPLVTSIVEDGRGYMWLGTNGGGLFCLDMKSGYFVKYEGIADIPTTFTYSAAAIFGGNVYFGTIEGMLSFSPSKVQQSRTYYDVDFMELRLLGGDQGVTNLYCHDGKVKLDYNQNFFTVSFGVPELRMPESVRFSCRLDGLETDWRDLEANREVSYTNVPPGKYKLYVRCIDATGKWGKPSVLYITVTPPWWRTVWAMMLWTALIVAALIAIVMFYVKTQNIRQRMKINDIEKDATKKLSEAKLSFYSNVTHELRTPVFLIMGQLEELIATGKSAVSVPLSYLQMMYRSAVRLNRLVSSVLDIRKMDSGKLKLQMTKGDVITFCQKRIDDFTALCEYKDISFSFVHEDAAIIATFDHEKLDLILSNLITNAYKYTKEGGHVTLEVKDSPDNVIIMVKDNGIGILKEMQNAIFDDFFRTERGKKQSVGDGVGLSFVKQLVELHGGSIRVESEPEHGSTFIFNIPKNAGLKNSKAGVSEEKVVKTDLPVTENVKTQVVEYGNSPVKVDTPENPAALHSILIIDDEHETVSLLERSLSSDFKIYKAYDGETGLGMARELLPDIILCDLMLPKMDGMQILKELKEDKRLCSTKVVMFTAKTSEEDMIEAFDNGVDAYVTKPISLKYLRMRIDRLIAQSDAAEVTDKLATDKKSYNKEEQIFLLRCREIIDDNLTNEDFSVDFMADKLAMSHSSLYKKIKSMTGMSLIEFINEYKIYKAVQMFKQGAVSVDKVSYSCGFNDVKNFRETFKRKMKMTPKQYVQSLS